jgi:NAD dependent epimerase/dehydratase family enzyme
MVGGPLGSGRQYMPWVHWRDVAGLVDLALRDDRLSGPVNVVAPEAVTGRAFARALGRVLGRPSRLAAPRFALRVAVGELADYMVMSQRVVPRRAMNLGYEFAFSELPAALADLVKA